VELRDAHGCDAAWLIWGQSSLGHHMSTVHPSRHPSRVSFIAMAMQFDLRPQRGHSLRLEGHSNGEG